MEKRRDSRGRVLREGESQREDGRYMFRWTDNGERHTIYSWKLVETDRLPPGKRDGPALRTQEQNVRKNMEDAVSTGNSLTLNELVEKYWSIRKDLRPATIISYKDLYNHHVEHRLGHRPISALKPSDFKKMVQQIEDEDGIKRSSTQKIMSSLNGALELAVDDALIRINPAKNATRFSKKTDSVPKEALTAQQQTALVKFVYASPLYSKWGPLITCFLGTGLRIGELLGLRIEDVNFEDGFISVNHAIMYKPLNGKQCNYSIGSTKTAAGQRLVPLLSDVRIAFLTAIKQAKKKKSNFTVDGYTNFIFLNQKGKVFSSGAINEALNRIVAAYNRQVFFTANDENKEPLYLPHISPHTFRHTFATRLTEINELPIKYVQDVLGHQSARTTLQIYSHAHRAPVLQAFKSIDGKIVLR